jgi:WhiB family transcriptional regulator, redox-sensing transcriptional regulator
MSYQPQSWMARGACRAVDPEIFFSIDGASGPAVEANEAKAITVCRSCPVRISCLDWALTFPHQHGVAGGYSEADRAAMCHANHKRQRRAAAA